MSMLLRAVVAAAAVAGVAEGWGQAPLLRRRGGQQRGPPRRGRHASSLRMGMGVDEFGVLPFPMEECLMPGETKRVHLYEARFLAMFEDALESTSGSIAHALVAPSQQGLVQVVTVCQVLDWEKKDVGVSATLLGTHRAKLTDLASDDPYLLGTFEPFADSRESEQMIAELSANAARFDATAGGDTSSADGGRVDYLRELASEVRSLAEENEAFEERLRAAKAAPMGEAPDEEGVEVWGHELRSQETTLAQRMSQAVDMLHPGLSGAAEGERVRLLSFLAAASLDSGAGQVQMLQCQNVTERLELSRERLKNKQKMLAAKASLLSLKFDG